MFATYLMAAVAFATPPNEFVIDCSSWHGKGENFLTVQFEARDGTVIKNVFAFGDKTDPSSPKGCFRSWLRYEKWRYEIRENYQIVVWGSASSPIKKITFQTSGWAPSYTVRPGPAWVNLAPPPREKK